mgnify:CR=1 FL=1
MLIPIETNVYNIPERLKEIDKDYFVVFNTEAQQFEVHNLGQIGNTLALNIPYDELDNRTIDLVQKTRIENAKKIFDEIDRQNLKLEIDSSKKWKDVTDQQLREMHRYVTNHESKETIPDDAYTTRW